MPLPFSFSALNAAQKIAAVVLSLIVAAALVIHFTGALSRAKVQAAKGRLEAGRADAAMGSAHDAIEAIASAAASAAAEDALSRENENAIRQAPGAAAPVDPAVRAAGLGGLCKRAAYRGSQQCLQFTPAGGLEKAGAGRAAADR